MTDMIIQSIGGIAAVYGFAGILGVPKKFLLWAGIDGGIGWFVYLLVGAMTHSELLGAFFGAAVISVGANVCARVFKTPVTMILIPANMTLVPGAGMYRIVYHILYPEGEQAAYYFQQTLLMAGMIAIAMFIVNIIWSSVTGAMKKRGITEMKSGVKEKRGCDSSRSGAAWSGGHIRISGFGISESFSAGNQDQRVGLWKNDSKRS